MRSPVPAPPNADDLPRRLGEQAHDLAGSGPAAALDWASRIGAALPLPGHGRTLELWRILAAVGAADLGVARTIEPHVDALAILAEAGASHGEATYGVWAAEGAGTRLEAVAAADGGWVLHGRKPWCSLAGEVSHALVTAWVEQDRRGLFLVSVRDPRVEVEPGSWSTLGLPDIVTSTVSFDGVRVEPVGPPGWYLSRDGFAWGGMGVASVWLGGATGLARRLREQAERRGPDQIGLMHLGAVDVAISTAWTVLEAAACQVDDGRASGAPGALLAARVRQVVADTVETVTARVGHALGPSPLAHEPEHARRVADLALYVRQHHAERDQAALGRLVLEVGAPW